MDKKKGIKVLNVFAYFLLVLVVLNIFIHIYFWSDGWTEILWYCDLAVIFLVIGILKKNTSINSFVLASAIPLQFVWIIDFFINIFGFSGFGRTISLFEWPILSVLPSVFIHLLLIPVAFYSVYLFGFNKKHFLIYMFLFLVVCIFGAFVFSSYEDNINCVFYSCDISYENAVLSSNSFYFSFIYMLYVSVISIASVVLSHFVLIYLLRKVFKKIIIH